MYPFASERGVLCALVVAVVKHDVNPLRPTATHSVEVKPRGVHGTKGRQRSEKGGNGTRTRVGRHLFDGFELGLRLLLC